MKTNLLKLTLGTCICAAGWLAPAAPLQQADVAASPAWLLHVDCDGLRPTAVGQYILVEMDKPSEKAKLAIFQSIFSFDLRTQLHGVTLYGTGPAPEDGVLIVYADFDATRLVTLALAAKGYQSSAHGQNTIYNWIDDKKEPVNGVQPRVYAAIQGNRVIFGQREQAVAQALDIIAGLAPNLAGSKIFPDLAAPASGTIIEAAVQKMKLPDSDPNAALLKMSQSVQIMVGESAQQFTALLTLTADNDEIAGHLLSIAQGLVALGKLQTDKPESVAVANAVTFQQDGSRVLGNLVLPADQVVQMMKTKAAQDAAKKAAK